LKFVKACRRRLCRPLRASADKKRDDSEGGDKAPDSPPAAAANEADARMTGVVECGVAFGCVLTLPFCVRIGIDLTPFS
jgi:hypothetical protein